MTFVFLFYQNNVYILNFGEGERNNIKNMHNTDMF